MLKQQKKVVVKPKKPSKKELTAEMLRQRGLVKEVIWPILLKHSKSVKNAQNICKTLSVGMDAIFMQKIKEYQIYLSGEKLSLLDIKGMMNEGKEYQAEWALMEALQNEKIADAKGLIEGMHKELERLVDKELVERTLDSLNTEWL